MARCRGSRQYVAVRRPIYVVACRYVEVVFVAPGNIELVAVTLWHRHPDFSPTMEMMLSGLLSVLILAVSAWLAAKTRRAKWVVLPLVNVLCAYGAVFLDAGMRM